MLEDVLRYINNRFELAELSGSFEIAGNTLVTDRIAEGQYYWVEGSIFNDGLHKHPDTDMADEEFEGRLILLAVPNAVVRIAEEAEEWTARNAEAINGPYQSESFGGYSYTRAGGSAEGNENPSAAWQVQFGARLRPWRKLSRQWV